MGLFEKNVNWEVGGGKLTKKWQKNTYGQVGAAKKVISLTQICMCLFFFVAQLL